MSEFIIASVSSDERYICHDRLGKMSVTNRKEKATKYPDAAKAWRILQTQMPKKRRDGWKVIALDVEEEKTEPQRYRANIDVSAVSEENFDWDKVRQNITESFKEITEYRERLQEQLNIDSELNSRMFTVRLISHLTNIEFSRLKAGRYTEEEKKRIDQAIAWLKTKKFTHLYMPMFDAQSIYTAVKKVKHTQGLDVLIVDYFKGKGEGDAFDSYQELGRFVDMVKNQICGDMNIAGIGAAQATSTGKVADSAKIGRNASTIALIQDKTPEEIEADGVECGNKKLRICLNRNGAQMSSDEYIDLQFNGNLISYEEAKQHIPVQPF